MMTDENANTADLTIDEKLDQVLRKLGDLDARLAALESQGTGTTRPLLDQIVKEMIETRETLTARMDAMDARFDAVEKQLRSIDRRFEVFSEDHMRMRADIRDIDVRLTDIERRPNWTTRDPTTKRGSPSRGASARSWKRKAAHAMRSKRGMLFLLIGFALQFVGTEYGTKPHDAAL